ncbi:hypothetical protein CK516_36250 [Nostoc sp. 'Peltigera malacea cyanobiont' DB3992]|nr:hypothetical protein CK516_36250 [Nostoc sp. 'Peltigera malacea cyanobiont' DB3992]
MDKVELRGCLKSGQVLRVLVTAANVPEREGGKQALLKIQQMEHVQRPMSNLLGLTSVHTNNKFSFQPSDLCN